MLGILKDNTANKTFVCECIRMDLYYVHVICCKDIHFFFFLHFINYGNNWLLKKINDRLFSN